MNLKKRQVKLSYVKFDASIVVALYFFYRLKGVPFFRRQLYERVRISRVELYER